MSGMETDAKPLLQAMFAATETTQVVLAGQAQLVLARWAFKTAAVLTQVNGKSPFPSAHRREFHKTGNPPRKAFVRVGSAPVTNHDLGIQLGEFQHRRPHSMEVHIDGQLALTAPAYVSRFRLLNAVFEIFGVDCPDMDINVEHSEDLAHVLLPLWQQQHERIWWPPTSLETLGGINGLLQVPIIGSPVVQTAPPSSSGGPHILSSTPRQWT
ncbi:hypothetical protein ACWGJB_34405 [Streptomyces sp. NPDC054813]